LSQQETREQVTDDQGDNKVSIVAISGSLRVASYNSAVIRAFANVAPRNISFHHFDLVADIPLFNPDRASEQIDSVVALKHLIASSDGLMLASPEYAHGISGVMKNTLDWLVSDESFPYIPVALINTSPRAHHAQETLKEVITTMSGIIVESACMPIKLLGTELDAQGVVANERLRGQLVECLTTFVLQIQLLKRLRLN